MRRLASVPRRADGPAAFRRLFRVGLGAVGVSMDPLAVAALASAIQTQEGYAPGTLAYVNNNPGNLVYAGQPGATQGAGGFAAFPSYAAGMQALQNQITLDATRGTDVNGTPINTVGDLISSWAPASAGNNTAAYIASVSAQTGYSPSDSLLSLGAGASSSVSSDFSSGGESSDTGDVVTGSDWSQYLPWAAAAGLALLIFNR
jgi:hypothetical protein